MLVRKIINVATPLTPEQKVELAALREMKDEDITFDEDCMPLSEECERKNDYIMRNGINLSNTVISLKESINS